MYLLSHSLIEMIMKKIISISIIALLTGIGFILISSQDTYEFSIRNIEENEHLGTDTVTCTNHIEFTQDGLQLKKEVVQFKITFHQDDVVEVKSKAAVLYVDETVTSVYCLLTNGEKPLLTPQGLWYVPERKYHIITPRIRLSVGKIWITKIFQGKIGSADEKSGHFDVQAGESWYLTLAVPTLSQEIGFSVVLSSLYDSMEATELTRHGNVGLYTAAFNQFQGRYYSLKLHVLFGGCLCNVFKEITVRDGSVFHMWIAGHRKGTLDVYLPTGEQRHYNRKGIMVYMFLGNNSGAWKFAIKGWSFYYRMAVLLLSLDIDPHCRVEYFEQ